VRRVQVHGETVEEALAGQRTALALHGVERDEVARGDWLCAPGSLRPSQVLDVRFELLADYPREWKPDTRVRFHLGASEIIGRLLLLGTSATSGLRAGDTALAQIRLEQPTVVARGDRFVVRSYSPSRTVGGGSVIEPVAERRRRSDVAGLDAAETGSLESRLLDKLTGSPRPVLIDQLAKDVGENPALVGTALESLLRRGSVVSPAEDRWLSDTRWGDAREQVLNAVREYAEKNPARYGIMKGELKAGLKSSLDAGLFDLAFGALV